MTMLKLLTCEQAKAYYNAHQRQWGVVRAVRDTMEAFGATKFAVDEARKYW